MDLVVVMQDVCRFIFAFFCLWWCEKLDVVGVKSRQSDSFMLWLRRVVVVIVVDFARVYIGHVAWGNGRERVLHVITRAWLPPSTLGSLPGLGHDASPGWLSLPVSPPAGPVRVG